MPSIVSRRYPSVSINSRAASRIALRVGSLRGRGMIGRLLDAASCYDYGRTVSLLEVDMTLQDQRVVVMGGTSGIGLATAKAACTFGAEVIITGRDEQKLQRAVAELGDGARGLPVDAAEREQLERVLTEIGQLDHLVLALGGAAGGGPIASLDLGELRAGFEGKFWPHLAALQVALPNIRSA